MGSFALIYWRIKNDLTPDTISHLKTTFTSGTAYALLTLSILLIPVNWGIESYKWQLITKPVEAISYRTAMKSVYSGICVGNLAPARATEFLAKILFFKVENRPTIALLHFANGMFQLCMTIFLGIAALVYKLKNSELISHEHLWLIGGGSIALVCFCAFFVIKFDKFQVWVMKRLRKKFEGQTLPYRFNNDLIIKLFFLSFIRYVVFVVQFILILKLFYEGNLSLPLLSSIFIYFLLTTALPMFSLIEAAVRAAIALLVFAGLNIPESTLIISAVILWMLNIVVPSVIGYFIIIKENFDFRIFKR